MNLRERLLQSWTRQENYSNILKLKKLHKSGFGRLRWAPRALVRTKPTSNCSSKPVVTGLNALSSPNSLPTLAVTFISLGFAAPPIHLDLNVYHEGVGLQ